MKSSGVARGMTIDEAMKVLNMKRFNAQELNEKFRFRVQSVAQGLGGSLEVQKNIYTAWEYLNRMLARESSTHTEHLLRSADKGVQMNEKPKRLDMIPIKLSNPTRKVSVIIEKRNKARKSERQVKSILKVNDQELVRALPPIHSMKSLDNAETLNSAPGDKTIKRVRWNEKMNITYSDSNSNNGQTKKRYRRLNLRSAPSKRKMFAEKENAVLQLKEGTGIGKATSVEDDSADERKGSGKKLGRLMDELPKLLNLQTIPFKRVPALNEIYANPKRLSKHDQKSAALRMLWREESEQILKDDLPDKAKRKHTAHVGGKTRTNSGKLMRKSLQKQEEVLYRKFKIDTFPTISYLADRPTRLPQEQRTLNLNIKQASKGPYTPSRIKSWMTFPEELNPE